MRVLRVLLLVSLTFMLPVRGVMAAAMLCPPSAGTSGEVHASPEPTGEHGAHAGDAGHHGALAEAAGAGGHAHEGSVGTETCNLCSACCSVPPVPSATPSLPQPQHMSATDFPSYSVAVPHFLSDAQERPPRSI